MEVFKQKKSKFWWYDFAVRGKRFRRSTGETNKNRAEKIASLKFSEICEHGDPLPRKAPTVLEVSKRFLESVDDSRLVENSKLYYHRGWRLLSKTPVIGLRLDLVTNEVAGTLRFAAAASGHLPLQRAQVCVNRHGADRYAGAIWQIDGIKRDCHVAVRVGVVDAPNRTAPRRQDNLPIALVVVFDHGGDGIRESELERFLEACNQPVPDTNKSELSVKGVANK